MQIIKDSIFRDIEYMLMWLQFTNKLYDNRHNMLSQPFKRIIEDFERPGYSQYDESSEQDASLLARKELRIFKVLKELHLVIIRHHLIDNSDDDDNTSYMRLTVYPTQSGKQIFKELSSRSQSCNQKIDSRVHFSDMSKHNQHRVIFGWISIPMVALCFIGIIKCIFIRSLEFDWSMTVLFIVSVIGTFFFIGSFFTLTCNTYDDLKKKKYHHEIKKLVSHNTNNLPMESVMARFLIKHDLISKYIANVNDEMIKIVTNIMFTKLN